MDDFEIEIEKGKPVAYYRRGKPDQAKVHIEGTVVVVTAKEDLWAPREVVQRLLRMSKNPPRGELTARCERPTPPS